MPDAHDLAPAHPTHCAVCNEPLGGGPWWVVAPGEAAHEWCAPWARLPFPLRGELRRLRALRHRLRLASQAVDATIAWLERVERRWPERAAHVVERGREWRDRLEHRLRALGVGR